MTCITVKVLRSKLGYCFPVRDIKSKVHLRVEPLWHNHLQFTASAYHSIYMCSVCFKPFEPADRASLSRTVSVFIMEHT